jgi:hypothetical protein
VLTIRPATAEDLPALAVVMDAAIEELYFVVSRDGAMAGCGEPVKLTRMRKAVSS